MEEGIPSEMRSCANCERLRMKAVTVMGKTVNGCADRFARLGVPSARISSMRCGQYMEKRLSDADYD